MKLWIAFVAALLVGAIGSSHAAISPKAGAGDPHLQTVAYDPQQVVLLRVAPGYTLTIEFSADERIENVAIGNGVAWQVTPNKDGDRLFVKPTGTAATTDLAVITGARVYVFELQALYAPDPMMAYLVKFQYPTAPTATTESAKAVSQSNFFYKFSGTPSLRPDEMFDDGTFTYIHWDRPSSIAAIYVVDSEGHEALVNGALRDGRYVVDQIAGTFLFRLGADEASAQRRPVKRHRK